MPFRIEPDGSVGSVVQHVVPEPDADGVAELDMPRGATVLGLALRLGGRLVLWVHVASVAAPLERRRFLLVPTGQGFEAPKGAMLRYVGSYPEPGADTLHLFEVEPLESGLDRKAV